MNTMAMKTPMSAPRPTVGGWPGGGGGGGLGGGGGGEGGGFQFQRRGGGSGDGDGNGGGDGGGSSGGACGGRGGAGSMRTTTWLESMGSRSTALLVSAEALATEARCVANAA